MKDREKEKNQNEPHFGFTQLGKSEGSNSRRLPDMPVNARCALVWCSGIGPDWGYNFGNMTKCT